MKKDSDNSCKVQCPKNKKKTVRKDHIKDLISQE